MSNWLVVNGAAATPSTSTARRPAKKKVKTFENSQHTKRIIQNVYNFLSKLRFEPNLKKIDFAKTQTVTAEACGVSPRTVQNVSKEYKKNGGKFVSSRKSVYKQKPKSIMDDFNRDMVRRTIFEYYDEGVYPTAKKVQERLIEKINYEGSVGSVTRLFHNLGFRFQKCIGGRRFLTERGDIAVKRLRFLRKINDVREKTPDKPIFYLDETWLDQNHTSSHVWQYSNNDGGLDLPISKFPKLVLLHIGSAKTGFLPQCKYLCNHSEMNGQTEMNSDVFGAWFSKMLKALEEPSVIVMDNASYHSAELNKAPMINSPKQTIRNWLEEKKIPFSPLETKVELLEKVKINKKKERVYKLDEEARKAGHEVVRLPPYHCLYNPIELIWAQVKNEVASKNTTFRIVDVEKLTNEAIENVTLDDWKSCVERVEKIQKEDVEMELMRENRMESAFLSINPEDDDDSNFSDSDDDGDDCFGES